MIRRERGIKRKIDWRALRERESDGEERQRLESSERERESDDEQRQRLESSERVTMRGLGFFLFFFLRVGYGYYPYPTRTIQ